MFMQEWGNRLPVVIVPTKYFRTPTSRFHELGISLVIWANHNLRASIDAMQHVSARIFQEESLVQIEGQVASLDEVFRLQGAEELQEAERKYLPATEDHAADCL
jgi:phosphoenolpyruvate phosphomutase